MSIESGRTYRITNVKSGTVLDLSGTDGRTISGFSDNGGSNQKWQLGIDGPVEDGTPLIAVREPVEWDIYPDDRDSSVFRIYVPNAPTAMNIDLSDHGNATPGTKVTLWGKWEGQNQTWRFEQA